MGAAGVIVGIFLALSLSISWVSGDRQRTKLENSIKDEQEARSIAERDLHNAANQIQRDTEQITTLTVKLRDESAEKIRIERELASLEREKKHAEEHGVSSNPEIEKERERIRTELETKSNEDIAKLEARLTAAEEARKKAEEKWTQAELAASQSRELEKRLSKEEDAKRSLQEALKKYEAALDEAQSRLKRDGTGLDEDVSSKFKEIHTTIDNAGPAGLISATVSKELNDSIKELENILSQAKQSRLALKGMHAGFSSESAALSKDLSTAELTGAKIEREGARFSTEQLQKDLRETNGDEFRQRIANLEERLVFLKDSKKAINERWGEAMAAIGIMEVTSQRIETLLKASEKNGEIKTLAIGSTDDQLKLQTDIDALRKSREDMRQAIEKVKGAIAFSLESQTKRVLSESYQALNQLNTLFAEGRLPGQGKALAAAIASRESLAASSELKDEALDAKAEKTVHDLSLIARNISPVKKSGVTAAGTAACVEGTFDVYVVKKGDTLWKISSKKGVFGNPRMWPILYKYNLFSLAGPDSLKVADKLYIKHDILEDEANEAIKLSVSRGKWTAPTPHMKDWVLQWLKDQE